MGMERCILCNVVCNSKQQLDEHVHSMLHHRELETLKGRNSDHECRVCRLSVVGLTAYASHISSPTHKQRLERREGAASGSVEDHFNKELAELIQRRDEALRREEGSAKRAEWGSRRTLMEWTKDSRGPLQRGKGRELGPLLKGFTMPPRGVVKPRVPGASPGGPRERIQESPAAGARSMGTSNFSSQPSGKTGYKGGKGSVKWRYPEDPPRQKGLSTGPCSSPSAVDRIVSSSEDFTSDHLSLACGFYFGTEQDAVKGDYRSPPAQAQVQPSGKRVTGKGKITVANIKAKRQPISPPAKLYAPYPQKGMNSCVPVGRPVVLPTKAKNQDRNFGGGAWKQRLGGLSGLHSGSSSSPSRNGDLPFTPRFQGAGSGPPQNHSLCPGADKQLQEMLWKVRETLQDHGGSVDPDHHTSEPRSAVALDRVEKIRKSCEQDSTNSLHYTGAQGANSPPAKALSLKSVQTGTSTARRSLGHAFPSALKHAGEEEPMEKSVTERSTQAPMVSPAPGSDGDRLKEAPPSGAPGKLGNPAPQKWDLSRHENRGMAHEPNLNIARRIRNIDGPRTAAVEKDTGLKPALRQLIGSKGSRRNVHWEQLYQEACRKKQGKGMPRFGIEMVNTLPSDADCLSLEKEEDVALAEGFHWESLCEPKSSVTEHSLSESQAEAAASPLPEATPTGASTREEAGASHGCQSKGLSLPSSPVTREDKPVVNPADAAEGGGVGLEHSEPREGRRKHKMDIPCTETPSVKRKKNKANKASPSPSRTWDANLLAVEPAEGRRDAERTHVDQLLAVSLREEELNGSLQTLDDSLIQARSALQAAYVEMQRLLVFKQQVTAEMSALRTKRIEILQGMQASYKGGPSLGLTASSVVPQAAATMLSPLSSCTSSLSPSAALPHLPHHTTSPFSLFPAHPTAATKAPVPIKSETTSLGSPNPHTAKDSLRSLQDEARPSASQTDSYQPSLSVSLSGLRAELAETVSIPLDRSLDQAGDRHSMGSARPGTESRGGFHAPGKPGSDAQCAGAPSAGPKEQKRGLAHPTELAAVDFVSGLPKPPPPGLSPSVAQSKKKKKKKKKKKTLDDEPNDSNTDGESAECPVRKTKNSAKRSKELAPVPTAPLKRGQKVDAEETVTQEAADSGDSDSLLIMELPSPEIISINVSDLEDGSEDLPPVGSPSPVGAKENSPPTKLACNQVSSTSELDSIAPKSSRSQATVEKSKNLLGMASGPGDENEPTEGSFEGHTASVNSLQIHGGVLYTCSEDRTARAFDLASRKCVAVFEGHSAKVNCLLVSSGPGLKLCLYTGSSDQTIRCYSLKTGEFVEQVSLSDRVFCLHNRWKVLYAGLANGSVVSFNLMTNQQQDVFECHGPRAVSCLASTQEGARRILLVGSYDNTISVRDAKSGILLRTLKGHTKTVLCMKVVNDLVFSGSSDTSVHAHNIHTGELIRIYKGHMHAVTVVAILGKVMVTACLDKLVRLYELQSHDRLQVYGGHKDMVMCMAIYKSMIYTGCYDGSVQAVRLNLMQNYRCWWHGCSLIFGVMDHLLQHLLADHCGSNFQTLRCRWKGCDAFFTARNGTLQEVPKHMQAHVKQDRSAAT